MARTKQEIEQIRLELYGLSNCPCCGNDLSKEKDLWECWGDHQEVGLDYVEHNLYCPNEECGKELLITYSRSSIKEV